MQAGLMQHKIPQTHCQMGQAPLFLSTVNFSMWKTGVIIQKLLERFQWVIVFLLGGSLFVLGPHELGEWLWKHDGGSKHRFSYLGLYSLAYLLVEFLSVLLGHHFLICCTLNLALTGTGFPCEPEDRFPCGPRMRRLLEKFLCLEQECRYSLYVGSLYSIFLPPACVCPIVGAECFSGQ